MSGTGDWWCSQCKFKIYGRKDRCARCGARRPESAPQHVVVAPPPGLIARPGDWTCAECGVNNFASRSACFKCKKVKAAAGAGVGMGGAGDVVATTATTTCVVCLQSKLEIAFMPCGHVCACQTCAPRVTICPICRGAITEKKKVFIA